MAPRYVRIRLPEIPSGLPGNLIGLLGLIGFAVCVGALAGNWWWSGLIGSVFAVGLSWISGTPGQPETEQKSGTVRALKTG